jgi:enolase-phosphatase E1
MPQPALLLDIEGTTTSISFVFDVLFPYAASRVESWVAEHANGAAAKAACDAVAADATPEERALGGAKTVVAVVRRQMAGDVKATGLKQLQGLIWQHGYERGEIKAHVFADVPKAFRAWKEAGRAAAIYSSGSKLAQQLLFRYSEAGDLTPLLTGYYDTTSGPKREAASYTAIAKAWGRAPGDIRFATDQPAEAEAARAAGMDAVLLMRPGNAPLMANQPFAVHGDLLKI